MTPQTQVRAPVVFDASKKRPPLWFVVGIFGLGCATVLGLTLDQPLVAVMAPLAAIGAWVFARAPLKVSALGLLLGAALLEGLQAPFAFDYENPLYGVAKVMLLNLNAITGIGALRLPLIDMLTLTLYVVSVMRRKEGGYLSTTPTVRAVNLALVGSAATIVALDILGTLQGGNFNESLWQLRHVLLFPLRTLLLMRAFDMTTADLKLITRGLIVVGCLKAMIGIWYLETWVKPFGREVEFTTSHSDTMVFVPLLALAFNLLIERISLRILFSIMLWAPIVTWGMIANDRRLAYVALAISMVITLLMSRATQFKRLILQTVIVVAPFIPPYVLLGWSSQGGAIFWAARLARSVIEGDPSQKGMPDYRDLENVNVLFAWAQHPIIPQGFGHKMGHLFDLPDISFALPTWEYHPHNQYLWLMTIGGPVGFTLMMLPLMLGIFLCARAYAASTQVLQRAWCLTGIAILAGFFFQTYGDMGTLGWTPSWMAALAVTLGSKLAMRTGAWPMPPERTVASRRADL